MPLPRNLVRLFSCIFILLISMLPLFSDSLTFEIVSGAMHGKMRMGGLINDSINYTGDIHNYDGFLGRLVYQGAPTTFSITSMGPFPTHRNADKNKFHFTKVDNLNIYREIVLLCRAKGYVHNSQTNGEVLLAQNYAAANLDNSGFTLNYGAGSDPATKNELGYNASGAQGLYDGQNEYCYKYKYRVITIDLSILRVKIIGGDVFGRTGAFETNFLITTDTGLSQYLNAGGFYTSGGSSSSLDIYSFTISPEYTSPIPFSDIEDKTSINNSLKIATIHYLSPLHNASISFSTDPISKNDKFRFIDCEEPTRSFRHELVFQPTLPSGSKEKVTASTKFFTSTDKVGWESAMGYSENQYRLIGDLYLYVDPHTVPFTGKYVSTIYAHVTCYDSP